MTSTPIIEPFPVICFAISRKWFGPGKQNRGAPVSDVFSISTVSLSVVIIASGSPAISLFYNSFWTIHIVENDNARYQISGLIKRQNWVVFETADAWPEF